MLGSVALDFANTARFHALGERKESLRSYGDLLDWSARSGLLTPAARRALEKSEAFEPMRAAAALGRAVQLRDAIQGILSRLARRRPVPVDALALLNLRIAAAGTRRRLQPSPTGFVWVWEKSEEPDQMLDPVAMDTADLLSSRELERLRECAGRDCSRFFIDTSRNGSRRWCSMAGCGNRAKARRHYSRTKGK
jgi:predicted RNA-binding Zn ribbon-like protein